MVEIKNKKICPLISYRTATDGSDNLNEDRYCYENECAWWMNEDNVCSMLGLSISLKCQVNHLSDILKHLYSQSP